MKALILAHGELYKPGILRNRIRTGKFDLTFATDGGARYASTLNVTLDAIIGDMDSIPDSENHSTGGTKFICYPAKKNETDLELALDYAEKQGAEQITIVCAMGGRMDMTIANILLVSRTNPGSCRIEVWHGEQTGWVIKPPGGSISGNPGDTISMIPISACASGITTKGLRYPLKDEKLNFTSTRGVSNLLDKTSAHLALSEGFLLVVHSPSESLEGFKEAS